MVIILSNEFNRSTWFFEWNLSNWVLTELSSSVSNISNIGMRSDIVSLLSSIVSIFFLCDYSVLFLCSSHQEKGRCSVLTGKDPSHWQKLINQFHFQWECHKEKWFFSHHELETNYRFDREDLFAMGEISTWICYQHGLSRFPN